MDSSISKADYSTAASSIPDLGLAQQCAAGQGNAPPQTSQPGQRADPPIRAQRPAGSPSRRLSHGRVPLRIPPFHIQADASSVRRATSGNETGPSAPRAPATIGAQIAAASANRQPPELRSFELRPFVALRQKYPFLRWYSPGAVLKGSEGHAINLPGHIFVQGPDGKLRRSPGHLNPYVGVRGPVGSGEEISERHRVLGTEIHDAARDKIRQTIAEFVCKPDAGTAEYQVYGESVPSICAERAVFALPDGNWMILQIGIMDSTFDACEEMLLGRRKSKEALIQQLRGFGARSEFRTIPQVRKSIEARSGFMTAVVNANAEAFRAYVPKLQRGLATYGSCIFFVGSHDGGEVARMLDGIEISTKGLVLAVRDPYPGSALEFRDHEAFWTQGASADRDPDKCDPARIRWVAIFLTDRPVGGLDFSDTVA